MQTLPVTPIGQQSVVQAIIEEIKQLLINGTLKPGQRLPTEQELAEQLSVGRGSVREAMKMLAAMGVVEIRRGDGTYIVKSVSPAIVDPLIFAVLVEEGDTTHLFEFRAMVDIGYCKLAAQKADEEDFARMASAVQALETYWQAGGRDSKRLAELDLQFHYAVLEATKNPLVIKVGQLLISMFSASIQRAIIKAPESVEETIRHHRRLLETLKSRDLNAVERAVMDGLRMWKKRLELNGTTEKGGENRL